MGNDTLSECLNLINAYNTKNTIDPTGGATHYLNIELTKELNGGKLPSWVYKMEHLAKFGKHDFYREKQ